MDDEATDGRFLGCAHERYTTTASKVRDVLESQPQHRPRPLGSEAHKRPDPHARALGGSGDNQFRHIDNIWKVVVAVYSMKKLAKECGRVLCELTGAGRTMLGTAPTPFLDESKEPFRRHTWRRSPVTASDTHLLAH
mgnify:CR=1 FL=1